jgi:hypothetical protein
VQFSRLTRSEAGTYYFFRKEKKDPAAVWQFDDTCYLIEVEVTERDTETTAVILECAIRYIEAAVDGEPLPMKSWKAYDAHLEETWPIFVNRLSGDRFPDAGSVGSALFYVVGILLGIPLATMVSSKRLQAAF